MKEIEIKISIASDHTCHKLLEQSCERIKEVNEYDMYYGSPHEDFPEQDRVLRLRNQNEKYYLAYKAPRTYTDKVVSRDEYETHVADGETVRKILDGLGYMPMRVVEKRRVYFHDPEIANTEILLDELPFIGKYIEVEGTQESIARALDKYKLDRNDAVQMNYRECFMDYLEKHNVDLDDPELQFTFEDAHNLNL